MTPELHERWISGRPPFDGLTISFADDDLVPLPVLRQGLLCLVEALARNHADRPLCTSADWHEHDGYISEDRGTSWDEVRSWLASDDALQCAMQGDYYVRTTVAPQTTEFYLRFFVPDDSANDYPETRGDFDLTCEVDVARRLAAIVESLTGFRTTCEPAKEFFDRSYGG